MNNFSLINLVFDYKHANSILISLMHPKNIDDKKWRFISVKGILRSLLFKIRSYYSTLWLSNPEDFYLLCFIYAEQLNLNPENFPLELIGR
jgi:hypothetical protein